MAASNKTQMVLSPSNSIIVSNGEQPHDVSLAASNKVHWSRGYGSDSDSPGWKDPATQKPLPPLDPRQNKWLTQVYPITQTHA